MNQNRNSEPLTGLGVDDLSVLPSKLDHAALQVLDRAAETDDIDVELLQSTPARDIRKKIGELVTMLVNIDHQRFLDKQGRFARLTGADVEARLRFELATQKVLEKVKELRLAVENGRRVDALLDEAKRRIESQQQRFDALVENGQMLLERDQLADEFIRARFERRLSSIMALNTANSITLRQIDIAHQILATLLDRFKDVETVLLPVWQQNVFALAHAAPQDRNVAGVTFASTHADLIQYLKQD